MLVNKLFETTPFYILNNFYTIVLFVIRNVRAMKPKLTKVCKILVLVVLAFYFHLLLTFITQLFSFSIGSAWLLEKPVSWLACCSRWIWWGFSLPRDQDSYHWSVQAWAVSWSSGWFSLCFCFYHFCMCYNSYIFLPLLPELCGQYSITS